MLKINNYNDFAKFLAEKRQLKRPIVTIGVTAFMRFFPALFLNNLHIICYKDCDDNKILGKFAKIFCLQKVAPKTKLKIFNTNNLLRHKKVRDYLKKLGAKKYLYLYRSNINIQNAKKGLGIKIIANKAKLSKHFENKINFRIILKRIGLKPILGQTLTWQQFKNKDYNYFYRKYGSKFVIQLPDFLLGGGKGTIFINNSKKFIKFKVESRNGIYKEKKLKHVNVTKFIDGWHCSVACCATKYGTLISGINRQIIDIPEVISSQKGDGLFCGHVFGLKFDKKITSQINNIATKLGRFMYKNGYKGIFGIDLLINKETNRVYPVECNARYTGAFPMLSMLHVKHKIIPLDFFHFWKFFNLNYKINQEKINKMYQRPIMGSHLVLSNITNKPVKVKKSLKAGLYHFNPLSKKITFRTKAIFYEAIKGDNDFILIDGLPKKGDIIQTHDNLARICHVLFKRNILSQNGALNYKTAEIVRGIYNNIIGF